MARIPEPTVQQLEKRRVTAEAKRTITELMNRINDSNLTENERLEAGQNLDRLVELQAPGVEEALKQINNEETAKTLLYFTPGIGQAMAAGELVLNPTWENAGWAALSIVPFARGGARAAKSLGVIKGAKKFGDDITWEIKNALETAQDYIRKPAQKTKVGSVAGAKGDAGEFGTSGFADDIAGARRAKAASDRKTGFAADERRTAGIAKGKETRARNIATKGLRKGAPVTGQVGHGGAADMTSQLMDGEEPQQPGEYLGPYSPEYYSDLAETSPELVRRQARAASTNVVTDQRTGDPSGLDAFRPKPTTPETPGMTPRVPSQKPDAPDSEQPITSAPTSEQPITSAPTDEEIENLLSGEGVPDRFSDDTGVVSDAFRRERDRAFGRQPGDVYYERDGMAAEGGDFERSPEGQAFLQSDVMPPELVKPDYMSDEEWATLSDAEKRRIMAEGDTSFASTFGAGTQ